MNKNNKQSIIKQRIIFSMTNTFFVVSVVSFIILWKNIGFSDIFLEKWLKTFVVAWPVAFTISFFMNPIIQKFFKNKIK